MKTKLPIIAILLLLLSGTAFGGYYYTTLEDDEGPCAALVSEHNDTEEIEKPDVVDEVDKPEVEAEPEPEVTPEPEAVVNSVDETTEPTAKEKMNATKNKIEAIIKENGGDIDAETQKELVALVESIKMLEQIQTPQGNFKHTISGKVFDANGEAVKGAQLMLQIDSKDSLQGATKPAAGELRKRSSRIVRGYVRSYATTDAHGQFTFVFSTNVKEGVETLAVTMHSQQSSHLNSDSQKLTLRNEETTTNLAFNLKQAGLISGRVVDGYGAPIKGARVSASQAYDKNTRSRSLSYSRARQAVTDELGNFKIHGLNDGKYVVYGWANGYQAEAGKQQTLTVVTGQETFLAGDLILNKQATLSFTLSSSDGAVSGRYATLIFHNTEGKRTSSRSARIAKDGKVTAAGVPSGSIQFTVYVNGYDKSETQFASIVGGEESQLGTIMLTKSVATPSSSKKGDLDRVRELKDTLKGLKTR
ncbi:MAG: carboxypeptidase-like regulatory domain-containing protein [Planctomycetota bacterium]|jgi:protocatechuate 3,4-dioxygenase beta subunit